MRPTRIPVLITILLIAGLFLTACGSEPAGASASVAPQIEDQPVIVVENEVASEEDSAQESIQRYWVEEVPRADEQGAVEIVITPPDSGQDRSHWHFGGSRFHSCDAGTRPGTCCPPGMGKCSPHTRGRVSNFIISTI
jgi:hypothetical protein